MPVPDPAAVAAALPAGDRAVEVGVGTRPAVASALAATGVEVVATDVRERDLPPSVTFVQDDVTDPDLSVYADADLVYAIHCPPELHASLLAVGRAVGAAVRFTTLGGDPPAVPARPRRVGGTTVHVPTGPDATRGDGGRRSRQGFRARPEREAMEVDGVVLDLDGVLVDVAGSYRRAIVESVATVYGETIDREDVQAFKNAGGFNDDWAVTWAVALYVLARDAGYEADIAAFTDAIADRGGGLQSAEAVVADDLPPTAMDRVRDRWDTDRLRDVFQARYLGADLYRELEGPDPPVEGPGYIWDEPVIAAEATLAALTDTYTVAVLTGRPAAEAAIALDRVGLALPDDRVVTRDDWTGGKPDPDALVDLATRLELGSLAYVGDTLDDVETVANARRVDPDRTYFGVGVLSGGLSGAAGRAAFDRVGADLVVDSINDLPPHLENP